MLGKKKSDVGTDLQTQLIYRCKKCLRFAASQENVVDHKRGAGERCFKWKKRSDLWDTEKEPPECSSIFVEPMKWMQAVEEGTVEEKFQCLGCKARLGSFNQGSEVSDGCWQSKDISSNKLLERLRKYGISGILSYGLLNTVYYLATFFFVCGRGALPSEGGSPSDLLFLAGGGRLFFSLLA
ncbi:hypothetical protein IFM89_033709 [Coptis chinensis]|uniref:Uncharacterized protein n=1 Tax=Coptis chinensis TaxID=261450 RepID=A0A835H0H1_9MAGN|nr:hypothetical protein IFM89_033709 [Coptis chinensis]